MTQLRKMMLEELQRRNYSQTTVKGYLKIVEAFAKYFHRAPDQLGPEQIRAYQKPKTYLFPGTANGLRADNPITPKMLWEACREAAQRAGITKPVRPHLLRTVSPRIFWKGEPICPQCRR